MNPIDSRAEKAKIPANTPNGTAGPSFATHSLIKNVHAKAMIDFIPMMQTKQSPDIA